MRTTQGRLPWLAVGEGTARALLAAGVEPGVVADDVHEALVSLVREGRGPVLLAASAVGGRPRAALRALRRASAPHRVLVWFGPGDRRGERVERAARALGVGVVESVEEALASIRASPAPSRPSAKPPGRRAAAPSALEAEAAFVDGCFRRLDRADSLCRFVLKSLGDATGAGRASLMLLDLERTGLFVKAALGMDPALVGRLRASLSSGVAGRVASLGRALSGRATEGGPRGYRGTAYVVLPLGRGAHCEGVACLTDLPDDEPPSDAVLRRILRMGRRAGRALGAARRLEHAETQSTTDELTGLPNRRAFERALHREVERARRSGAALGVGMLDVDHFKGINDRFGHPVGDRVLAQVARRLATAFRETDLVCRVGGEEFAVLLTGLSEGTPAEALAVLERARRSVGERPLALGPGLPCPVVTVSAGVAVFPRDAADGPELVHRADQALYGAKNAGRDRGMHA